MTIQEEIREGIAHIKLAEDEGITVEGVPGYIKAEVIGLSDIEEALEFADSVMEHEDSQGVVIKVTQKYPLEPHFIYEPLIKDDK